MYRILTSAVYIKFSNSMIYFVLFFWIVCFNFNLEVNSEILNEFLIQLSTIDSEEEKKKQELRESAQKELDDWYARYKEQIEKSKLNNR